MMTPVIEIDGLEVRRGDNVVLKDLNIAFGAARIVGVVGPNGAGKTTLMETIAARLAYSAGELRINGDSVADNILKTRASVSVATEPTGISLNLTGRRYLEFVAATEGYRTLTPKQAELVKLADLADHLDRPMTVYSHGMLKKLAVVASLNETASIYIFDEIFNGLDIVSLKAMKSFFLEIAAAGKLILLCSHFLQILYEWCDEVVLVNNQGIPKHWRKDDLNAFNGNYEAFETQAINYY